MALLLIRNNNDYESWLKSLKKEDPTVEVLTPETVNDPASVTMALTWKAPQGSFDHYPNLKVIGSMGAGVDHLFEDPSLPHDVILTRVVDDKLASDMQEFVAALCLSHIRNLKEYDELQQKSNWNPTSYKRAADVQVGILGLGTLGQAVGKMLTDIGFQVSGWSLSRKQIPHIKSYSKNELDDFLTHAKILICLLPLTEETRGILDSNLFSKLPDGAFLINVARGGHLVEDDLLQALDSKKISGAALDVFNTEPLPKDHPFWERKEITITPHIASMSNAASVAPQVIENYNRMSAGKKLKNTVSRAQKY